MRIYIAGPMSASLKADFNYPAFFAAAEALSDKGFDTLNPADNDTKNTTGIRQSWDWYMRHAIAMVLEADAIALLPGWDESKGARLEWVIANELGLDIRNLDAWLS